MTDFRRRNLVILGALACLSVIFAVTAVVMQARETASHFTPGEFLPGFSVRVKEAARIHIVSHDGSFDVLYAPGKGWVLPAKGDYPADFEQVRHTLIGLAALETVAPKTARRDWLSYIGLAAPPKGSGIAITVTDASGKVLAALITGNSADLDNPEGGSGLFVRHAGDNHTYLARAIFTPHGDLSDWMERGVLNVEPTRVNSVTITPVTGPSFTVSREHNSDLNYKLEGTPAPKGYTPSVTDIDTIPDLVDDFTFMDVKPVSQVDFSKAAHLAAHTFDSQNIHMDAAIVNGAVWVRVSAEPDPGTPTMQKQEAAMIDARSAGWAYKLPADRGRFFTMQRDKLFTKATVSQPNPPQGAFPGVN
ncbi:MAG: DUF4340 domain-containing protein [Rhizomicrobium sp.]